MYILRLVWYFIFWTHSRNGLSFLYSKMKMSGKENVPKGVPVIFGANHENALIDPMIITTRMPKMIHYLVRASVFKNPIVSKFLKSFNLMPVYRVRDGVNSVIANKQIFKNCFEAFKVNESLMLFPEANHDIRRIERKAKKGIARIALGAVNEPDAPKELFIVPVGINYSAHQVFGSAVHVVYGKPFKVQKLEETNENIEKLASEFDQHLKLYHVSFNPKKYEIMNTVFFHDQSPKKTLDPVKINEQAKQVEEKLTEETETNILNLEGDLKDQGMKFPFERKKYFWLYGFKAALLSPFGLIALILYSPVLLVSRHLVKGAKDKTFKMTIYYGIFLALMPILWAIVGIVAWKSTADLILTLLALVAFFLTWLASVSVKRNWTLFVTNYKFSKSKVLKAKYEEFVAMVNSLRA